MTHRLIFYFLLILFAYPQAGRAQPLSRYNTFSYSVNEGLLQSNIIDMQFDSNNFCWISFANGIQKFDGKKFYEVPLQPGLPDDKWVYFFKSSTGDLLLSHSLGISKYNIGSNTFTLVHKNEEAYKVNSPVFMGEEEGLIYFSSEKGVVTGIDNKDFKVKKRANAEAFNSVINFYRPKVSGSIVNHRTTINMGEKLYLWDFRLQKAVAVSKNIPTLSPYFIAADTGNTCLYCTYEDGYVKIWKYDFISGNSSLLLDKQYSSSKSFRAHLFQWQDKTLLALDELYETLPGSLNTRSKMVTFQNQHITGEKPVAAIREDNYGNLYLVTINDGFRKMIRNNYPLKYFGASNKKDNYILNVFPDKEKNRVLAGTYGSGLLVFDTLQRLVKHMGGMPGFTGNQSCNMILKNDKGEYILFFISSERAWKLDSNLNPAGYINIRLLPEKNTGVSYFSNTVYAGATSAIAQTQSFIYKTDYKTNSITEHRINNNSPMGGMLYSNRFVTHVNNELYVIDTATFREVRRIPFKNTGGVRCFINDEAGNILMGSNKGIFRIDSSGNVLEHFDKTTGLPDECIYALAFDGDGALWCSTNKGIFKLNKDKSILQLTREDGLQESEFNTNVVARSADGELFFGGINGVSSFYPSAINSVDDKINLLFTNIRVNNREWQHHTAPWDVKKLDLPYDENSLSFDFVAMAGNNPDQYIYQYQMEGIDKEWILNSGLQTVRYLLPPGDYTFKIYASRFFDKDAKAMKEIKISIHPPFWKTWWFLSLIALLFSGILIFSINRYNRNKYRRKLQSMEAEYKLQMERQRISRDLHDNIGAYANAVLYNTELLQKENDPTERSGLMNDLRFASKDIITALRETVWALKKEQYSAQDCLLRIRNFIHPFNRYYAHINFMVEGEAPANMQLHSTRALDLVRMVQEAVANAIKHSGAKHVKVESSFTAEYWQLRVSDDGSGFNQQQDLSSEGGNGLNNMKQRAADSHFQLTIDTMQHQGTIVSITVNQ